MLAPLPRALAVAVVENFSTTWSSTASQGWTASHGTPYVDCGAAPYDTFLGYYGFNVYASQAPCCATQDSSQLPGCCALHGERNRIRGLMTRTLL